ncbi:MAG: ABC transporter ATP-binding protein [Planctomycetota bacterium]
MIELDQLRFRYPGGNFELEIDRLHIAQGEKVAIVGPSGCGKTTLLNLVAGISTPDNGSVTACGDVVSGLSDSRRRDFRISKIGMVFQRFDLVEYLNARDNILLPFQINRSLILNNDVRRRAHELAESVGIGDKTGRYPHQLSQGEQQRVAICRALVAQPELLLADEPTGNLDPASKTTVLDILLEQCDSEGKTLVVVTHDMSLLNRFDRSIDFTTFFKSAPDSSAPDVSATDEVQA